MTGVSQIHVQPELSDLYQEIQAATNHDIPTIRHNLSYDYFQEDEDAFDKHLLSFRAATLAARHSFSMAYDIYVSCRDLIIKNLPCEKELFSLNSAGVQLVLLPPEIGSLLNLVAINLRTNCLLSLPIALAELPRLQEINIVDNKIQSLPSCLFELPQLQVILSDHDEENERALERLRQGDL